MRLFLFMEVSVYVHCISIVSNDVRTTHLIHHLNPIHSFIDSIRCLPRCILALAAPPIQSIVLSCSSPNNNPPSEHLLQSLLITIDSSEEELTDTEICIESVVKSSLAELNGDWRSAAKALHTLHHTFNGCASYQSKILARTLIERYHWSRSQITHTIHRLEQSRFTSLKIREDSLAGWKWVGAYLDYLNILCETRCGEEIAQYSLSINGPENLLRLAHSLTTSALQVTGGGISTSGGNSNHQELLQSLLPLSSVLIHQDITRFVANIHTLVYDTHSIHHENEGLLLLAENVRASVRNSALSCYYLNGRDSRVTFKPPLLPRWILAL